MKNQFGGYTVVTVPSKENQVIESLKNKVESENMSAYFRDFKIFTEPKISKTELEKKRRGEAYTVKQQNIFKGYIFVNMIMTDDTGYLTRNTEFVTGIVGSHGEGVKPTPISKREYQRLLEREEKIRLAFEQDLDKAPFSVGDLVKIIEGPLANDEEEIYYPVKSVNEVKKNVTIEYEFLGKKTPTELEGDMIKKLDH